MVIIVPTLGGAICLNVPSSYNSATNILYLGPTFSEVIIFLLGKGVKAPLNSELQDTKSWIW